jgi:predicted nuclease of predicted toxin-antitoxin system
MKQLIDEFDQTTGKIFSDEATPAQILDWLESEVIENAKWLELEEHHVCVCAYDNDQERFYISGDEDFLYFSLEDCEVII